MKAESKPDAWNDHIYIVYINTYAYVCAYINAYLHNSHRNLPFVFKPLSDGKTCY